ncbi:DUF4811 domain-containing protein [Lactiplantibacillus plantarum]|uniref:DUF4811 domain-containing protein n=1 Tax=Lactiplantibacillus plantarum TaxID=1590 RepID=UPI000C19D1D8|nr:DUF4811 domain-containing protein [Lactiplantibacillus plantarum]PKX80547.1 DUF4811 domain-containing protein [Lactiplantibacillus plantarum]
MILVLLVVSAIALFLSFIYVHQNTLRISLSVIFAALLVTSIVFVSKNDGQHYGMVKTTTTTTQSLKSAGSSKQLDLLLYQSVGTADKHRVYIYKKTTNQKKVSHTTASVKTANQVKTTTATPKLVTKMTRWTYKSNAMKFWFGLANNDKQLIKRTNYFYINKNWVVLSTTQAKQFSKLMKQQQATLKARAKVYVTNQVKAAMVKNPTMSKAQLAKVQKAAAAQYQANAIQSMLKTVKASK